MTFMTMQDFIVVLPMLALFAVSLIPIMIKVITGNREPNPISTLMYSFIGLIIAIGLTAALAGGKKMAFADALVLDGISVWSSCLVYVLAGAGLMLAYDHVATRGNQFSEFAFLLLSSTIGMVILIMANDLIITFIGIETMSLCLYIIIAMSKEDTLSKEAAFKYFVLGSFASAIFLYGVALIWGTAGTTYFPALAEQTTKLLATNRIFLAGIGMVILGFGFKVALFPLQSWVPDVYQGAPTPVTAFMSTAVKAASFVAFLRLFNSEAFAHATHLYSLMMWLAALTMLIGNVAAIMQDNLKRMLAYSSVAHSGYAMVGLIAAGFGSNASAGTTSLLFYLFSYAIMTIGSFALVAVFEKHENTVLSVNDLKGLASKYPVLALSLSILLLSLAGVPPTLGFFSKFYLFSAAIEQDMYWLALWGVINSVISVVYYLRPIVMMYMSDGEPAEVMKSHMLTRAAVVFSAILIVALGIFSSPLLKIVQRSVLNLF